MHPTFLELEPTQAELSEREFGEIPDSYLKRVTRRFPNIPVQAYGDWIFSHHDKLHVRQLYAGFDFDGLAFQLEDWEVEKCMSIEWHETFSDWITDRERETDAHFAERNIGREWVVTQWMAIGTWSSPPWVLDSASFPENELVEAVKRPFMLVEGHSRLGVFRRFQLEGRAAKKHKIWVLRKATKGQ